MPRVSKKSSETLESRVTQLEKPRDRFLRLLRTRLPDVEMHVLRLRNLSNRGSYNYNSRDVDALETLLNGWVKAAIAPFRENESIEPEYMKLFKE